MKIIGLSNQSTPASSLDISLNVVVVYDIRSHKHDYATHRTTRKRYQMIIRMARKQHLNNVLSWRTPLGTFLIVITQSAMLLTHALSIFFSLDMRQLSLIQEFTILSQGRFRVLVSQYLTTYNWVL